jgi:hypothetical protein
MPPNAQAALFQALKKIGGLSLVGDTVNVQGRHGVAFVNRIGDLPRH